MNRYIVRWTGRHIHTQKDRHRQTYRQTDRQTDKQTDSLERQKQKNRQTGMYIEGRQTRTPNFRVTPGFQG